eukprot:6186415-Pleurochrysis_carterae.AAC.2
MTAGVGDFAAELGGRGNGGGGGGGGSGEGGGHGAGVDGGHGGGGGSGTSGGAVGGCAPSRNVVDATCVAGAVKVDGGGGGINGRATRGDVDVGAASALRTAALSDCTDDKLVRSDPASVGARHARASWI